MLELDHYKGILPKILGEDISRGSRQLPAAGPDQPPERSSVIEVPEFGHVRIHYRLNKSPRRHVNLWFWTAHCAVVEPSPGPQG